jgi:hypothetical protein
MVLTNPHEGVERMDLHQNARLSFRSRETLADQIMTEKVTSKDRRQVGPPLSHPWGCPACGTVLRGPP